MTFIVGENCIKCKHTDCVEVCPVDCFYEGPNFLTIDPDECIDCGLCVPECPEDEIYETTDTEDKWYKHNEYFANKWPNITESKNPMPEYEQYSNSTEDKTKLFKAK